MSRVVVLGNATIDQIMRVRRLPVPGETLLAHDMIRCAGGKGLNQAVAAARTGADVLLVAPTGRDTDAAFLADSLGGETKLAAQWLTCDAPTDLSSIWVADDGENVIVSSAGCAHSVTPEQAARLCDTLVAGDILLIQGNLGAEATLAAAETARARGAPCVLNTAPITWEIPEMQSLLPLCDIVIANAGEAAALTGGAGAAGADASAAGAGTGAALHALGVKTAIVTLGPEGAVIADRHGERMLHAPAVASVDTAGAGDVFVGTLVGLLASGHALDVAARTAVAAASLSVTRRGTTPSFPTEGEVAMLLQSPR
ncbi:MAG: phosphomethylpyrimidine kinase family protein [Rhizobacter sp.]|nr:phosphomethylpyrimidine kinase family protein [Rhizobacter sp.]